MRALFLIVLILAGVLVGAYWLQGRHGGSAYAPQEAQDTDLAVQPVTEPMPPPPPSDFKRDTSANLPAGPVPYDQLSKESDPTLAAGDPNAPPQKKSNDKAIFY
jgi:hypothetical protein